MQYEKSQPKLSPILHRFAVTFCFDRVKKIMPMQTNKTDTFSLLSIIKNRHAWVYEYLGIECSPTENKFLTLYEVAWAV
jgi:hypothetical protein